MTTVTEAAKRLIGGDSEDAVKSGDLEALCADPVIAQRFARQIAEAVRELSPGREWSIEDLHDVFQVACRGPRSDQVEVLEGRYFRKRLREQCALADRYGDPFALVVAKLADNVDSSALYQSVLDAVLDRLRRTDMVFLYKRRFALILPRMRAVSLGPLIGRIERLVAVGAGDSAIESVATLVYPDPEHGETQAVLDWAEDQLRESI